MAGFHGFNLLLTPCSRFWDGRAGGCGREVILQAGVSYNVSGTELVLICRFHFYRSLVVGKAGEEGWKIDVMVVITGFNLRFVFFGHHTPYVGMAEGGCIWQRSNVKI